jgi:hypothetical protein
MEKLESTGQCLFMVDNFALAISHGLLAILAIRLMLRRDLDRDAEPGEDVTAPEKPKGFARRA